MEKIKCPFYDYKKEMIYMCYEGLEMDSLVTLEVALSRAAKVEKNEQMKKDIKYELGRVLNAMTEKGNG